MIDCVDVVVQLIAEENQVRLELQMALDSKDSDLEQLRCQLTSLSVHSLDSTSISSGNDLDVVDGYPGKCQEALSHPHDMIWHKCIDLKCSKAVLYTSVCTSYILFSAISFCVLYRFPLFSLWCSLFSRPVVFDLFVFILLSFFPTSFHLHFSLSAGLGTVRITHSHTSESMSFTYQRTHKSVRIDTRPNLHSARSLFDSDSGSEDEEEYDGRVEQGHRPLALTYEQPPDSEPDPAGDPTWWFKPWLGMEIKTDIDPTIASYPLSILIWRKSFFPNSLSQERKSPNLGSTRQNCS